MINTISFEDFLKKKNYLSKYSHIINCSINKNYNNRKYLSKYDFDLRIAKKINKLDLIYVLISTRKIYKIGNDLKENSKLDPKCNYSKNKLITEKKLTKLLNGKLLILRVSNLIGFDQRLKKEKSS